VTFTLPLSGSLLRWQKLARRLLVSGGRQGPDWMPEPLRS